MLIAALLFATLALGMFSPALLPGKVLSDSDSFWFQWPWFDSRPAGLVRPSNPEFDDVPSLFQPMVQFTRRELPDIPLWNPYMSGGRPFVANAQSGVFSPFNIPAYALPFWRSLALIAALKLFVAAFGTFLLARSLRIGYGGSLMAGLVYGFSLWMVTWQSFPHAGVWALTPWLLVLADALLRAPGPLPAAGLAATVGLQFAVGHPESSFYALLATVVFFALRLAQARRQGRFRGPELPAPLLAFGGALVGGTALAAIVLVPFGELLAHSADAQHRRGEANRLPQRYLLGMLLPDFWGRPTQTPVNFFLLARAVYAGALPLMLAAAALILRPRGERLVVGGFALALGAIVFGIPPLSDAVTALPGAENLHLTRVAILFLLCLALLAGWGLDDLSGRLPRGQRARAVLWFALALFLVPLAWLAVGRPAPSLLGPALKVAWGFANEPLRNVPGYKDEIRLAALIVWLTLAGAGLGLLALRLRRGLAAGAFVALCLALVAIDLFRAGMGYNPAIDRDAAFQPATPALRYLQSRRPDRFAGFYSVAQGLTMRYRLYDGRGYDLPVERRIDRFWRQKVAPETQPEPGPLALTKLDPARLQALGVLSVTDVLQPPDYPPLAGLRRVYQGRDGAIYRNGAALPRAFVVDRQQVVGGEQEALNAVTSPRLDGRRMAVTEHALDGLARSGPGEGPSRRAGRARITSYQPDRVALRASAPGGGLMVLTDVYYPGWQATVDGKQVPIERVDYLLRGVALPPGSHTVVFSYRPLSWRIGWIVSLVALLGLAAAVAVGLWRKRRA